MDKVLYVVVVLSVLAAAILAAVHMNQDHCVAVYGGDPSMPEINFFILNNEVFVEGEAGFGRGMDILVSGRCTRRYPRWTKGRTCYTQKEIEEALEKYRAYSIQFLAVAVHDPEIGPLDRLAIRILMSNRTDAREATL